MALHDSLRDLVSARGAGVVDEADELRGALDDFLAEDEATVGELNLLVDAVRLGALRRVLSVLEHGAEPAAAIREAGAALARDRGTDDPTRSCWAIAALGFALGRVDDALVRMFRADAGTLSAPGGPPARPAPPPVPVDTGHGTAERPSTQPLGGPPPEPSVDVPPPPPPPPPEPTVDVRHHAVPPVGGSGGPVPPVSAEPRGGRAGLYLFALLVALILGGLVAAGVILLRSEDDDPAAADDPGGSETTQEPRKREPRPLVAEDEMLVPYREGESSVVYVVDAVDGGFRTPLTSGPDDVLPTLSPDRRTATYLRGPRPPTLMRVDLETGASEPFFPEPGPCDHALRPGWSFDGAQVAVVCTGDDDLVDGIWLADADGGSLAAEPVVDDSLVRGSPTWISETAFIYGRQDDASEDAPLTFWRADITGGEPTQLDLGLEGLQLTHADYSPEAGKVLFLVSARGGEEVGDVWTMNPDGTGTAQVATGAFAHPVWSPDGTAIGVTLIDDAGAEVLAYVPLDDAGAAGDPVVVENVPPGEVGIPVWGTR